MIETDCYDRYLILYDSVSFYQYLEWVKAIQSPVPGSMRQNQSPWLFLDSAQVLFSAARGRVFTGRLPSQSVWDAIPAEITPVLEEQPKWEMLANILDEIEREIYFNPLPEDDSLGTVLIMCEDDEEGLLAQQLRQYFESLSATASSPITSGDESIGSAGELMMRRRLRKYLQWKGQLPKLRDVLQDGNWSAGTLADSQRQYPYGRRMHGHHTKRRRTRGNKISVVSSRVQEISKPVDEDPVAVATAISELVVTENERDIKEIISLDTFTTVREDQKLYRYNDLVLIHPFRGDIDDRLLEETRPRYVIMYNPDPAFIRRVEVCDFSYLLRYCAKKTRSTKAPILTAR